MQVPLIRLQCGVNSYDWGKKGSDSAAARFAAATPAQDFTVNNAQPYAELWMGTHPSNPSKDVQTGRTLLDLVSDNQTLLSPSVIARYGKKLPFLFKILSIAKALSIQAHPNKGLAEQLHARDPKNYPDDNHKPEMAIALTHFEGLCGFRPPEEIAHFLQSVNALRNFVGPDTADAFVKTVSSHQGDDSEAAKGDNKAALKSLFGALMSRPQSTLDTAAAALLEEASKDADRFAEGGAGPNSGGDLASLITRLHGQFGPDYGLFVMFLCNLVTMAPGEAMFLRADDIHAYISGDIVECMAASDNVVRAGFTPKFKDVDTLVSMLTYNYAPIDEQKMTPTGYPYATLNRAAYSSGSEALLYDPPIDEFSVVRTVLKSDGAKATFDPLDGPSIVICTGGAGKISVGPTVQEIKEGYVFFVGSTAELVLEATGSGDDGFVTFKAFCEVEDHSNGA
ncbi:mannose-6-phosphate isomerase [Cryphonectria parasitica EP155]|uniref:Mannose-6-phosphate isomerase n=1 Tax=Cryphonectria parasitica (strain ATCC 38755 / EP155) TaxID=660469 RepID=A0A9P4XXR9_CRYP1|nr:mannose-6-phosphate isomerase [Cryphonectria parasitica EP155]KAF3762869.1 mannose-6-phosphate isomerase [Cryphonectria parasitica EP155]